MAKRKKITKIYRVTYYPPERSPTVTEFDKRPAALRYIREQFWDMLDTGDRLRRVKPGVYVLEDDYEATGERATADNYLHMYHWTLDEISVD